MPVFRNIWSFVEDIHKRTPRRDIIRNNVLMVGAGGIGSWLAVFTALQMRVEGTIVIVDDDRVKPHNLNRFPYPFKSAVDEESKAKTIAAFIQGFRPDIKTVVIPRRIRGVDDLDMLIGQFWTDIVVDATDNPIASNYIRQLTGLNRLLAHYDGKSITVEWIPHGKEDTSWDGDVETAGYRVFPSLSYPPAIAAAIGVTLMIRHPDKHYIIQIRNIEREFRRYRVCVVRSRRKKSEGGEGR